MIVGIPREILENERRVAALPEMVSEYVKMGFKVLVEASAGEGALRSDEEYQKAGAEIVKNAADLFAASDVILKVKQPCFNEKERKHEVEMMKAGAILISFLHPAAPQSHEMVRMLRDRQVTGFTMDSVPRISRAQLMDGLTSMSTVAGYKSVIIAAFNFPKFIPMLGTAIGTIKPARFLVVGAGVVGLQSIATAKRLGGSITVVDVMEPARKGAESLGAKIGGFDVPADIAAGEGGYARALPPEWLAKEREALKPIVKDSDIVILSALVPGEAAPTLITGEMVASMRPGSVIVDVSVDQGGNCELTEPGHDTMKNQVFICGRLNIPGSMPVHASWLYANNTLQFVKNLFGGGSSAANLNDEIAKGMLVTHQGKILHKGALKAMGQSTS